jgi:hypothetical protein
MKWQSILAGALASVFGTLFMAGSASADVRIVNDPGGEVSSYLRTFYEMRATGERIVIDGPCLSACTLLTGIVPRDHVCVTRRAVLGFHAASYYNDVSPSLVPTRAGTRLVMRLYLPKFAPGSTSTAGSRRSSSRCAGGIWRRFTRPVPNMAPTKGANLFSLRLRS